MHSLRFSALFAVCAAVTFLGACDLAVEPTSDSLAPATRIEGTIRVLVEGGEPLGPAVLLRYDCADPPPPVGAGRPVDFLIIPEEQFGGGEAAYVFPAVPAESCSLIQGFIDRDRDFHYDYAVTGQQTAGDVTIGLVEVVTGAPDEDFIEPVLGVDLRAATVEPFDRPSFELPVTEVPVGEEGEVELEYPRMEFEAEVGETGTVLFDVYSRQVTSELVDMSLPRFSVVLGTDEDGDGQPDDDNGDGFGDVDWPRVLLFRLDPEDPTGATESDPRVVLPGVILPRNPFSGSDTDNNLVLQADAQGIPLDGVTPLYRENLKLAVPGLVVTNSEPLELTPIESVAASGVEVLGDYRLMVINPNGQLWYIPNELGVELVDQAASFSVVDEE